MLKASSCALPIRNAFQIRKCPRRVLLGFRSRAASQLTARAVAVARTTTRRRRASCASWRAARSTRSRWRPWPSWTTGRTPSGCAPTACRTPTASTPRASSRSRWRPRAARRSGHRGQRAPDEATQPPSDERPLLKSGEATAGRGRRGPPQDVERKICTGNYVARCRPPRRWRPSSGGLGRAAQTGRTA